MVFKKLLNKPTLTEADFKLSWKEKWQSRKAKRLYKRYVDYKAKFEKEHGSHVFVSPTKDEKELIVLYTVL